MSCQSTFDIRVVGVGFGLCVRVGFLHPQRGPSVPLLVEELLRTVRDTGLRKQGRFHDLEIGCGVVGIKKNTQREETDDKTIMTILHAVEHKMGLNHVVGSLRGAENIIRALDPDFQGSTVFDKMPHRATLCRSTELLADAFEEVVKQKISESRGTSFFGLGFETDESPAPGNVWSGHRFQITIAYCPFLRPVAEWEDEVWRESPPFIGAREG